MEKEEKPTPKKTTRSPRKKAAPKSKTKETETATEAAPEAKPRATKTTAKKKAAPKTTKKVSNRTTAAKKKETEAAKTKATRAPRAKKAAPKTTGQEEVKPLVAEAVDEPAETNMPGEIVADAEVPDNGAEIMASGLKFFGQLAQTLHSEESTEKLAHSLTEQDEASGKTYLKVPVESKQAVADAITMLSTLFKALQ